MRDVSCIADVGTRDDTCPYCGHALGRSPKRAATCHSCGRRYRVRNRKREDGRRVLTEGEALFLEALRGGSLVPELFTYAIEDVKTAEDLPHNNPVIVAQGDLEVNRRWAVLRERQPGAGPVEYLWWHYQEAIKAAETLSFNQGYLLFRQAELAAADLQYEAAALIILDAIYVAACGDALRMDYYSTPPRQTKRDLAAEGGIFIAPAWLRLVADLREALPWSSEVWESKMAGVAERWTSDWRAQPYQAIWLEIDKATETTENLLT